MSSMVRKQVYLTARQNAELRREAARQRRTEADLIREALDRSLGGRTVAADGDGKDPLWQIVAIGRSGRRDVSARADASLYPRPRRR